MRSTEERRRFHCPRPLSACSASSSRSTKYYSRSLVRLVSLCIFITCASAQEYVVPQAILEALTPRGFRVSIPDSPGVQLFAFHGNVNKPMRNLDAGELSVDIISKTGDRWVYHNDRLRLKFGDTINYWTYVQVYGRGYRLDDQSWQVTEFVSSESPSYPITTTSSNFAILPTSSSSEDVYSRPSNTFTGSGSSGNFGNNGNFGSNYPGAESNSNYPSTGSNSNIAGNGDTSHGGSFGANTNPSYNEEYSNVNNNRPNYVNTRPTSSTVNNRPVITGVNNRPVNNRPSGTGTSTDSFGTNAGQNNRPTDNYGSNVGQNNRPTDSFNSNVGQNNRPSSSFGGTGQNSRPTDNYNSNVGQNNRPTTSFGSTGQNSRPTDNYNSNVGQNNRPTDSFGSTGQNNRPTDSFGSTGQNSRPMNNFGSSTSQNSRPNNNYGSTSQNNRPIETFSNGDEDFSVSRPNGNVGETDSTFNRPKPSKPQTSRPSMPAPSQHCVLSTTTVNGRPACKNYVIFEETFKNLDPRRWARDVRIPSHPDFEFCVFSDEPDTLWVQNDALHIRPRLTEDRYGEDFVRTGNLVLEGCTAGPTNAESCSRQAVFSYILPPTLSARINTKDAFRFRYGLLEIRAKLPLGDWIYPEILLLPYQEEYGPGISSGRVQLAMARGNRQLSYASYSTSRGQIGAKRLEYGVLAGSAEKILHREANRQWADQFHNYSLLWTPETMAFSVDGVELGIIRPESYGGLLRSQNGQDSWSNGEAIAPFDKEFYLSLGLAVGGVRNFPDETVTGSSTEKPWGNTDAKAMLRFWEAKDRWFPTWGNASQLIIDSIRVTALNH